MATADRLAGSNVCRSALSHSVFKQILHSKHSATRPSGRLEKPATHCCDSRTMKDFTRRPHDRDIYWVSRLVYDEVQDYISFQRRKFDIRIGGYDLVQHVKIVSAACYIVLGAGRNRRAREKCQCQNCGAFQSHLTSKLSGGNAVALLLHFIHDPPAAAHC